MREISFIVALAAIGLSIASRGASAQTTPLAGSAGAGTAAVSGVPAGPGSAGGTNNSVNDPSGIGNAARIPPPPAGTVAPVTPSMPPGAGVAAPRANVAPSRRRFAGRRMSPEEAEIRMKENDRLLNSKLKSICKGC